jgi:large subunit ribosomal protein L24
MSRKKFHVSKGDQVEVVSGNHAGQKGKVLQVISGREQVLVEGVRMIKKHLRKSQDNPQGSVAQREGPIHVSNVRLVEKGAKAASKE